jgi:hypothetical protein
MLYKYRKTFLVVLAVFLFCIFSCSPLKDKYTGTYIEIEREGLLENTENFLELNENGNGTWRVLDDEVRFRWSLRRDEIRLHTKEGGIIVGKIQGDIIEVTLSGRDIMYFKRSKIAS